MKEVADQRKFFDHLAIQLKIKRPQQWLNIQPKTILNHGGSFLVWYYKGSVLNGKNIEEILLYLLSFQVQFV
jgi:hypothetical protein